MNLGFATRDDLLIEALFTSLIFLISAETQKRTKKLQVIRESHFFTPSTDLTHQALSIRPKVPEFQSFFKIHEQ